ncbi:MAG: response regulator [Planctomycetes bacterium]|nr:response regulator [Planctomycetota bacterium]
MNLPAPDRCDRRQAAADRQSSDGDERFRLLFQANLAGVALHELILDSAGRPDDYRFLDLNPAFETLTGLRRQNLIGRTVREALPGTERQWIERYGAVALSGVPDHFEQFSAALGRWYEVTAFRIATLQFAVVFNDVTERRRAEAERAEHLAFQQRLLETVPSPIFHKDLAGVYRGCNQAFLDFLGCRRDQLVGRTVHDLFPAALAQRIADNEARLLAAGGRQQHQLSMPVADGSVREVQLIKSTFAQADGRVAGLVGVIVDLTGRIQSEQALREALVQAQAASVAKSQFLSTMSHEIRTPLNGVIGMTELLLQAGLTPAQAEMAAMVKASGQGLMAVIGDVLDLAKIEAGHLELSAGVIEVRQLAKEVRDAFAAAVQSKGLELVVRIGDGVPPRLRGDPVRLRQVLINLLGNAVKFTCQGAVALQVEAAADRTVTWAVSDTGPGIPADFLPRLFLPFTQADATPTRAHGGSGLGLAISLRLAELMGGTLTVETRMGLGSCFRLALPLVADTGAGVAPAAADRPAPVWRRAPAVLVVEDDPTSRHATTLMLQTLGCRPEAAADGDQALGAIERQRFDLVLMDCRMPGRDGYETTRAIRARPSAPPLPIIALTANVFTEDRRRCLAAGMDGFLAKPCTLEALGTCLASWLGTRLAAGAAAG